MSPWEKLLEQPHPKGHLVQLYTATPGSLVQNVGRYLFEGARRGDGLLVVSTTAHQKLFRERLHALGADPVDLTNRNQLVFLDAQATLSQFLMDGQPDWHHFEKVIRAAMRQVEPPKSQNLRVYGEMVGILWAARLHAAAIRVEQLWNRLLEQSSFSLFCGYELDVFENGSEISNLESVLCAHTHLIPAQQDGTLEAALNQAMDEILGARAETSRAHIKNSHSSLAVLPTAERILLWLRKNLPGDVEPILSRAQIHYQSFLQPTISA
jgi:hypothetical protein